MTKEFQRFLNILELMIKQILRIAVQFENNYILISEIMIVFI